MSQPSGLTHGVRDLDLDHLKSPRTEYHPIIPWIALI